MIAYLDNAATTAVWPEVAQAAAEAMTEGWYNPSARYPEAVKTAKTMESHRATVARALGCKAGEVVFTSCGTESDNWAIRAGVELGRRKGRHIVTTAIEHSAVLAPIQALEKLGYEVTYLPVNKAGTIDPDAFEAALREDTVLVSMMLVNNELGTVFPVKECVQRLKRRGCPALFHCDGVQGFMKVPCNVKSLGVDLFSISGHKLHAPKGIGALYIRSGLKLPPMIIGGGQESGLRSGTEPTAQIAALAKACELGMTRQKDSLIHMAELKAYALERIATEVPEVVPIVSGDAPHILALSMVGYKSEVLVRVLGDKGIYVSAGSACHRGTPSHVYAALGLDKPIREGAFRVSFCGNSTRDEVDALIDGLKDAAKTLFKSMS